MAYLLIILPAALLAIIFRLALTRPDPHHEFWIEKLHLIEEDTLAPVERTRSHRVA